MHETSAEVQVYLPRNCVIEAGHEATVGVFSNTSPAENAQALTEPRKVTAEDVASLQERDIFL